MWKIAFWKATAERALSTVAQAALALLASDGVFNVFGNDVDLSAYIAVAGSAGILSILKALAANALPFTGPGPSLVPEAEVEAAEGPGA
jgi:hypothetical protein